MTDYRDPEGEVASLSPDALADRLAAGDPIRVLDVRNRDEFEAPDGVDLLIQSGRTIDAIRMDGWRVDVGFPEDRDAAESRLGMGNEDHSTSSDENVT